MSGIAAAGTAGALEMVSTGAASAVEFVSTGDASALELVSTGAAEALELARAVFADDAASASTASKGPDKNNNLVHEDGTW